MADQTFEAQQFAEALARANAEMERYGKLTQQTQTEVTDASMKAKYGLNNFTQATSTGADAAINLAKAFGMASKAMLDGKRGASAFNDSLDQMSTAITLLGTAITLLIPGYGLLSLAAKGLTIGLTLAAKASIEYAKAANEMADKLHKGYQGLAESGAAAADGMTGLFSDAKKLGLAMNDIGQYTSLVAANSKDLALFSGTVYQGRKAFADVVGDMEQFKMGLMNTGLTQEQINAGAMGYLKLQTRIGQSQNQTTKELAAGANKYLLEMDALSKITGETRKGMEDTIEAARNEERFAAKLQELRATGRAKEARQLELTNVMLSSQSKEAGQGFRDLSTGMITTDAAQKLYLSTQGKALVEADKLSAGLTTAAGATQVIATAAGDTATNLTSLGKAGVFGETFIGYAESLKLGILAQGNLVDKQKKAEEQIDAQVKGADGLVSQMSGLIISQQKANAAAEGLLLGGISRSVGAMDTLTGAVSGAASMIQKVFGITPGSGISSHAEAKSNSKKTMAATTNTVAANYTKTQITPQEARNVLENGSERDIAAFGGRELLASIASRAPAPAAVRPAAPPPAPPPAPAPAPAAAAAAPTRRRDRPAMPPPAGGVEAPAPAPAPAAAAAPAVVRPAMPRTPTPAAVEPVSTRTTGGQAPAPAAAAGKQVAPGDINKIIDTRPGEITVQTSGGDKQIRKGTAAWRMNNPGNLRGAGTFLTKEPGYVGEGDAGPSGWFSVWKTKQDGINARETLMFNSGGRSKIYLPTSTIRSAMTSYAPPKENDTEKYIRQVSEAIGVPDSTMIKELSSGQKKMWGDAITKHEGNQQGKVISAADGGMFGGPKSGYPATLHGNEAVIPLKNGAVPVSLNASEVFSNLKNEIETIVKEIAEQSATNNEATVKMVADEFKSALSQMNQTKADQSNMGMTEMLGMLSELVAAAKSGNDISSKILRSAN